ncbi:8054_t:CDS:2, partial [Funneliformis geosporum]
LDAFVGMCDNHNPGFLVDGFSNDIQLFDDAEEKEIKEEVPSL